MLRNKVDLTVSVVTVISEALGFSLEMPVPSHGHYGFHSFPFVD
jgi:hypothetical protein